MTTSIQTCGSRDSLTDEFTLSMCFGESPALTFEGLTREQIVNLRDCLDCMLWDEVDNEYGETLDAVTATLEPYVPGEAVDEAAAEVLSMIRDLLLRKVEFNDDNLDGVLHWPNVESMMTRPLDY
jgi:hypothetical protein